MSANGTNRRRRRNRVVVEAAGAIAVAFTGDLSAAAAATSSSTRLIACPTGTCLLISGRRDNGLLTVSIDGHMVPVEGVRHWRVRLPLATLRGWSPPLARTITITLHDPATDHKTSETAALPIGLLGHSENLALLVIGAR